MKRRLSVPAELDRLLITLSLHRQICQRLNEEALATRLAGLKRMAGLLLAGDTMSPFRMAATLAAIFALAAFGCSTSSVVVRPDKLGPEQATVQARTLTDALAGNEVVVELAPRDGDDRTRGPVLTGTVTALDNKAFLLRESPERAYPVPFEYTRSLSTINRKKGATEGMLVGIVLGGITGAIFGAEVSRIGCDQDVYPPRCPPAIDTAVPVGVVGAFLGGALGAGLGAIIGHRLSFTF